MLTDEEFNVLFSFGEYDKLIAAYHEALAEIERRDKAFEYFLKHLMSDGGFGCPLSEGKTNLSFCDENVECLHQDDPWACWIKWATEGIE